MLNKWKQLYSLGNQISPPRICDVKAQQHAWLLNCLRHNRHTAFGIKRHFSQITSIDEYREQVPYSNYDDLAMFISRMSTGESDVLFKGQAVAFETTGGTSGKKLIPYSRESLDTFRNAGLTWLSLIIDTYKIAKGSFYWAISPALRETEYTCSGIKVGLADADYFGTDAARLLAQLSAVPFWVGNIVNFYDWQLVTLYFLIVHDDLEFFSIWSPTFLISLIDMIANRHGELIALLQQGAMIEGHSLAAHENALIRLNQYWDTKNIYKLWPNLKLISCWMDASSEQFAVKLKQSFPDTPFQSKGLLATEGIVTIPDNEGRPVLSLQSGFYEFIDDNNLFLAHELTPGKRYEVVMTTAGGLYRYRIGDRVICEDFDNALPILRFTGRVGMISDLVGEKLTEDFVAQCLNDIPNTRFLFPDIRKKPRYVLAVDHCDKTHERVLIHKIESELSKNPQYAYARKIDQLDEIMVYHVPHLLKKYTRYLMSSDIRLGDIKIPSLRTETHWLKTLMEQTL